jgi:hypothetical protein
MLAFEQGKGLRVGLEGEHQGAGMATGEPGTGDADVGAGVDDHRGRPEVAHLVLAAVDDILPNAVELGSVVDREAQPTALDLDARLRPTHAVACRMPP